MSTFQITNKMRLELIVGHSTKSMDGVHRSVFVQARTREEEYADDDSQVGAGRWYVYHRKITDIILLEATREEQMNCLFAADLMRQ